MVYSSFNWYAIYTKSNFEKKIYAKLVENSIETYLPLRTHFKQWSDRKKKVQEPLIRSYLFVRITEKEYQNVLRVPGVVKFISFSDRPITIPDYQIDVMKKLLADGTDVEVSSEHFAPGDPVEIVAGKLMGLTGELIESKGNKKVIIRIDQLDRSLLINISSGFIKKRELLEVN